MSDTSEQTLPSVNCSSFVLFSGSGCFNSFWVCGTAFAAEAAAKCRGVWTSEMSDTSEQTLPSVHCSKFVLFSGSGCFNSFWVCGTAFAAESAAKCRGFWGVCPLWHLRDFHLLMCSHPKWHVA